jgi:hypothetical protein
VAPLGVILTVPTLFWIESAAVLADVGIAATVTVPVNGEAPVGVILTVPSAFAIESTVVLADVGTAETLAVALDNEALVLRFRVFEPTVTEIKLAVVVGALENVPVCDAAVGALAVRGVPPILMLELPLMLDELRVPWTVPVPTAAVPSNPVLQSFFIFDFAGLELAVSSDGCIGSTVTVVSSATLASPARAARNLATPSAAGPCAGARRFIC